MERRRRRNRLSARIPVLTRADRMSPGADDRSHLVVVCHAHVGDIGMNARMRQLQDQIRVKEDALRKIFTEARKSDGSWDFTAASVFEHCTGQSECYEHMRRMEEELDTLGDEYKTLESIEQMEKRNQERYESRQKIDQTMVHAAPGNGMNGGYHGHGSPVYEKSLGTLVKELYPRDERPSEGKVIFAKDFDKFNVFTLLDPEVKATMTTTAGWAPEVTRIPRVVEFAHRPVQVLDTLPVSNTDQAGIQWMEETTSTSGAVETAENTVFTESAFAFTERSATIRKIATFIPVTDEQLADVSQVAGLIDARLRFFLMQRLDLQVIAGNGVAPNILGFVQTPGLQTQAMGTDNAQDAIYKAMDKVRVAGRATPNAVYLHPNDWQGIRLLRTSQDVYYWGPPTEVGIARIWGLPVVITEALVEGTAMVGDFANFSMLWMRQGVEILAGYVGDDFKFGRQAIRATLRAALSVYRPAAFCLVTGI
jgi:HK97 family phage major capsid protein